MNLRYSKYSFEQFAPIRRYTYFDFLGNESSWIIYTADTTGQFNLWRQRSNLNTKGEPYASYQLTNFVDDIVRVAFSSPIDNSIIFFADYQGTENYQIYYLDVLGRRPRPIMKIQMLNMNGGLNVSLVTDSI